MVDINIKEHHRSKKKIVKYMFLITLLVENRDF